MSNAFEPDKAFVDRLLTGDETAFASFFDTYFPRLYRFVVMRVDRNDDAAEDIVQAALCTAVRKLATYRGEATLFTWLCTFCRHEISAFYARRGQTVRETTLMLDAPEVRAALESLGVAATGGPEDRLLRSELASQVRATLDALPDHYGDALEWKYIQDLSVDEIAGRLRVSSKAAESLLSRARNAFRDLFATVRPGTEAWER